MGKFSREKGKRGERMAAKALSALYPGMERQYNQSRRGSDAPDIDAPGCPWWVEVKFCENSNQPAFIRKAFKQATTAAKNTRPVLLLTKVSGGPWYAIFETTNQELIKQKLDTFVEFRLWQKR